MSQDPSHSSHAPHAHQHAGHRGAAESAPAHGHAHAGHRQGATSATSTGTIGTAATGAQWTCPMHPEILRDASGDCPICGMALVPVAGTGAGAEADDSEARDLARRLRVGVALSIPLVVLAMAPMIGIHEPFGLQPRARGWVEIVAGHTCRAVGAAGRFCINSGSRLCIARSTCTR